MQEKTLTVILECPTCGWTKEKVIAENEMQKPEWKEPRCPECKGVVDIWAKYTKGT